MLGERFIAVSSASRVTVDQLRQASSRLNIDLAVVLEDGTPLAMLHGEDLTSADANASVAAQVERGGVHLHRTSETSTEAPAADWLAFEPRRAVIVHRETPFVVSTSTELHEIGDVHALLAAPGGLHAFAPFGRLPGKLEPPPPGERHCFCVRGHQITVPPGQSASSCPWDGLPLRC